MGVVVSQVSRAVVVIEARLCLSIEGIVEIFLDWMQSNRSDSDETRRKVHVLCLGFLCATQEALVENLILEDKHGASTIAAIFHNVCVRERENRLLGTVADTRQRCAKETTHEDLLDLSVRQQSSLGR